MSIVRRLWRSIAPNPLDRLLKQSKEKKHQRVLLVWNRGLGDIALGLYAIIQRIKHFLPDAEIIFLTRKNLKEGFELLKGVEVIIAPTMSRKMPVNVAEQLKCLGLEASGFDLIIENPDPTYWVKWQLGKVVPRLNWKSEWNGLHERFSLDPSFEYIGAHVQTESGYASWRDWPTRHWERLFALLTQRSKTKILLFGFSKEPLFSHPSIIDLRGETSLLELLSIIKNRLSTLIVPDSGIGTMTYFLDAAFPLKFISLWSEKNMGILKQNVASPNPLLVHRPLMSIKRDLSLVTPERVYEEI